MKKITLAAGIACVLLLGACGPDTEAPTPVATPVTTPTPTQTPSPTPTVIDQSVTVIRVIDGDTIETSDGTVRIIGIDTPEKDECGFKPASDELADLIEGETVTLTAVPDKDDTDQYDRLLRYVTTSDNEDAGLHLIEEGYAIARYDSRDGYGAHPMEDEYIAADEDSKPYTCPKPTPKPTPKATAKPKPKPEPKPEPVAAEPWNEPGPDLDCPDIGHPVEITGEDYHDLDRDGDGWGCTSS